MFFFNTFSVKIKNSVSRFLNSLQRFQWRAVSIKANRKILHAGGVGVEFTDWDNLDKKDEVEMGSLKSQDDRQKVWVLDLISSRNTDLEIFETKQLAEELELEWVWQHGKEGNSDGTELPLELFFWFLSKQLKKSFWWKQRISCCF